MKRQCQGVNRRGEPCQAAPLRDSEHCAAHDPTLPDDARFGSPSQAGEAGKLGGKATRKPRPLDIARQLVEQHVEVTLAPHFRTLGYDIDRTPDGLRLVVRPEGGAKLHGTEQRTGEVRVSEYDDLGAHVSAAEKLLDRVYGRPRQAVEHTGEDGAPIRVQSSVDLSRLSVEEKRALLALVEKANREESDGT